MHNINTAIRLTATTKKDLVGATVLRIDFTRPDGTTGSFAGTLVDGQRIVYESTNTDFTQAGAWQFSAYAEKDGKTYRGKPFKEIFK